MSQSVLDKVPVLSLTQSSPGQFAQDMGESFARFGFAMVKDHGLDQALIDNAWAKAKAFFALPEDNKRAYHIKGSGGARGYTPFRTEIAKGADENDLKEFWHIGRDLPDDHRYSAIMKPNIWPFEVVGFQEAFQQLYAAFDHLGSQLLSAIAIYLGLTPDWFEKPVEHGNSVLRLLHYPPVSPDALGIRAGAHEDINLITLLLGAEEAGLELLDRDGNWLPVDPPKGALVVNVGDMLQRLTNHVLPSTTHRVVNPSPERRGHARYSMPFFLHLAPDFIIDALPQTVTADNPKRHPLISANDYLMKRLVEIGLIKP